MIFIPNVEEKYFSDIDIAELYRRRWDIEGSFRDINRTLQMEQWHSKKLNGILQEIYATLWFANNVKFECFSQTSRADSWFEKKYKKTNFKLCAEIFMDNIELLIKKKFRQFKNILLYWIKRTIESRERFSRQYPRIVKKRGQDYQYANLVDRRG